MEKKEWREEAKFLFGHLYIDTEEGFTKIIGEENDLLDFIESEKQKSYEEGYIECISKLQKKFGGAVLVVQKDGVMQTQKPELDIWIEGELSKLTK